MNASESPATTRRPVDPLANDEDWSVIEGYVVSEPSFGDNLSLQPPGNPVFAFPLPGFLSLQLAVDRAAINRSTALKRLGLNATLPLLANDLSRCCPEAAKELAVFDALTPQNSPARFALESTLQSFYTAESFMPQQVFITSTPVRAYKSNGFFSAVRSFLALFVVLGFLFPLGVLFGSKSGSKKLASLTRCALQVCHMHRSCGRGLAYTSLLSLHLHSFVH